jgi:predicted RNA binding protein YcfA (HicA-like mRNA interferase family)
MIHTALTVTDAVVILHRDGWVLDSRESEGTYREYRHTSKPGRVSIVGQLGDVLSPVQFANILRQARIGREPRTEG